MKRFAPIFAAFLMLALPAVCHAQTSTTPPAPTPSALFSFSTQAVMIHLDGTNTPGTDVVGQFYVTKNNIIQSDNILAPGIDFQGYYGGIRRNFSIDSLIAKTNIPKNTFLPYVHAAGGVVRFVPANGPTVQNLSAIVDAGFDYDPTGSGKFSFGPRVGYLYAPGFGSSPHGAFVSADLTFVLGSK